MGAVIDGDVWDFFVGKGVPKAALPVGTVLTISAAGSEASNGTVITNEDGWLKRPVGSELIYPRFSILNPELAFTTAGFPGRLRRHRHHGPPDGALFHQRAECRLHRSPARSDDEDDHRRRRPRSWRTAGTTTPAAELMWASTIAHNNLLNTGRVGDWASHDIEHELSGIYDVAHGAGLAVVFPAWMKYVLEARREPLRPMGGARVERRARRLRS